MKFFTTLILCLGLAHAVLAQSSNDQINHSKKSNAADFLTTSKRWKIELGVNAFNDSRSKTATGNSNFANYFDPGVWDYSLLTLHVDYTLSPSFYLSSTITRNANKESGRRIFATDINLKYTFAKLLPTEFWLEPYVLGGMGYSFREISRNNRFNLNFGAGTYFWLDSNWGIDLQAVGKVTMKKDLFNYKQNTLGLVYKF